MNFLQTRTRFSLPSLPGQQVGTKTFKRADLKKALVEVLSGLLMIEKERFSALFGVNSRKSVTLFPITGSFDIKYSENTKIFLTLLFAMTNIRAMLVWRSSYR